MLMKNSIKEWLREFFGAKKEEFPEVLPSIRDDTVKKLIDKATEGKPSPKPDKEENPENPKKGCCSYAVKRNIVASIEEVRRFAEEHKLPERTLKALLTIAADMLLNALNGKVKGSVLLLLLNAMNFDKAKSEAYSDGEKAGRNQKIIEEYFPTTDDGVPEFNGVDSLSRNKSDIFTVARDAR